MENTKTESTLKVSKRGYKIGKFAALTTLILSVFTFIVSSALASEKSEPFVQQFNAIADTQPRQEFIDNTLAQAEKDYTEGRISHFDYWTTYEQMRYLQTEAPNSYYVEAYGTPETKQAWRQVADQQEEAIKAETTARRISLATGAVGLVGLGVVCALDERDKKKAAQQEKSQKDFLAENK